MVRFNAGACRPIPIAEPSGDSGKVVVRSRQDTQGMPVVFQFRIESLVKQTEMYVKKFVTPKVCDESGATSLAGETCQCPNAASKLTESVANATKDIQISYRVGEKEFTKYHDARRYAKKTHQKGVYLVGEEKFKDELEARLAVAHKKYRSEVMALQATKAQAETAEASEADTEVASKDG